MIPLAQGAKIGAFCLSEPEAGSDATSQRTTAIDKGDHYLLNGTKIGLRMAVLHLLIWLLLKQMWIKDIEE